MDTTNVKNVVILSAELKRIGSFLLTLWLHLGSEEGSHPFGGYVMYLDGATQDGCPAGRYIYRILQIADASEWGGLPGKRLRVLFEDGAVCAIGHALRDDWFWPYKEFTERQSLRCKRPVIVCLCGSGRFRDAFESAEFNETLAGHIVLTIGCNTKDIARDVDWASVKPALDRLHKQKIDLADEILVLNVGGYIGDSTRSEISYAKRLRKRVRYLEEHREGKMNGTCVCGHEYAGHRGVPLFPGSSRCSVEDCDCLCYDEAVGVFTGIDEEYKRG